MSSDGARDAPGAPSGHDPFDELFESVPFVLMLLDRGMRVVRINRRGAQGLGRRPEEVAGLLCGEALGCLNAFAPPGCGGGASCAACTLRDLVAQTFATGASSLEAARGHFHTRRGEEGERPLELLISTALVRLGPQALVLATIVDVTDQAILESRLAQAQKMEAIGTLAGGIAHDFNNILGVIIGNAELLEMGGLLSDAERHSLGQILAAARRAKHLVRQILAFSRRSPQERLLINLKPIVKETVGFLRASLPVSVTIEQAVAPADAVVADPTQIQQVLLNLCANAAQAMGPEGGRLRIELANAPLTAAELCGEPEAGPGRYVRLSVADTGPGIPPEIRCRIFEPFFTTKGPEKGTGLGLSVVHGIVTAHGGFVRVAGRPGEGARFDVFLPSGEPAAAAAAPEAMTVPVGRERILFVDDEAALAELARQQLTQLGYRVAACTVPLEALALFEADPAGFDLVVSDLSMPQMSGLALAGRLRALRPELPVILCTGFGEQADEAAARAAGVRAFLFKPLLLPELAQAVRRALDEPLRQPPSVGGG